MKKLNTKINSFFKSLKVRCSAKCTKVKEFFKKNKILSVGLIIVIGAFLFGYLLKGLFIAALVNGKPISRLRVVRQLEKYQGATTLESIITEELIKQEAKKMGVKVTAEEVTEEILKIEANLVGQGQSLDEILSLQGMTRKDLETNLILNKLIEKILTDKSTVTDEEVQSYIDTNKDSFPAGTDMEQVKTLVRQQLVQEKMGTQYQSWIEEIKAAAKINVVVKY